VSDNDVMDLKKLYPDNNVEYLYRNQALYRRIYNHARKRKQNVVQYLNDLGFIYSNSISISDDKDNSDFNRLISIYPDYRVVNISKNTALYETIKNHAKKKDLTIDVYLGNLGFTMIYPTGNRRNSKNK
jgi:hypothetical protein